MMPGFDLSDVPLPPSEDDKKPSPVRTRSRGRRSSVELPKDTTLPTPPGRRNSALHPSKKDSPLSVGQTRKQIALPTPPSKKDVVETTGSSKKEVPPPTRRSQRGKRRESGQDEEPMHIAIHSSGSEKDGASDGLPAEEISSKGDVSTFDSVPHQKENENKPEQTTPVTRGRAHRFSLKNDEGKGKVSFHIKTNKKPIAQHVPSETSSHSKKLSDEDVEVQEASEIIPKPGQVMATKKLMYRPDFDDDDTPETRAANKCLVLLQKVQQKTQESRAKSSEEKILSSIQPIPELSRKVKLVPYDDDNGDSEKDTDSPVKDRLEKHIDHGKGRRRTSPSLGSEYKSERKAHSQDRESSRSPISRRKTRSGNERDSSRSPSSRRKTRSRDEKETSRSPSSRRKTKSGELRDTSRSPSRRKTRSSDDRESSRSPVSRRKTRSGNGWDMPRSPNSKKKNRSRNEREMSRSPPLKKKNLLDVNEASKSSRKKTRSNEDRDSSRSPVSRRKTRFGDGKEKSSSPVSPASHRKIKLEDMNEGSISPRLRIGSKMVDDLEESGSLCSERKIREIEESRSSKSPSSKRRNRSPEDRESSRSPSSIQRNMSIEEKERSISPSSGGRNRSMDERETSPSPSSRRKLKSGDERGTSLSPCSRRKNQSSDERDTSRSPSLRKKNRYEDDRESSGSPISRRKNTSVERDACRLPSSRKKYRSGDMEISKSPSLKWKTRSVDEVENIKSPDFKRKNRSEDDRESSKSPVSRWKVRSSDDRETSKSPTARRKTRSGDKYERRRSTRNSPSPERYRRRYSPRRRSKSPNSPRRRRSPARSRRRRRYSRSPDSPRFSRSPDRYRRKHSPRRSSISPTYSRSPERSRRYKYSPRLSSSPDSPDRFGRSSNRYRERYSPPFRSRSPGRRKYESKPVRDKSSKKSGSEASAMSDFDIMSIPLPDSAHPHAEKLERTNKAPLIELQKNEPQKGNADTISVSLPDLPLPVDTAKHLGKQETERKVELDELKNDAMNFENLIESDKSCAIPQGLDVVLSASNLPIKKCEVPVKKMTITEKQKTDSKISFKLKAMSRKSKFEKEVPSKSAVVFSSSEEDESQGSAENITSLSRGRKHSTPETKRTKDKPIKTRFQISTSSDDALIPQSEYEEMLLNSALVGEHGKPFGRDKVTKTDSQTDVNKMKTELLDSNVECKEKASVGYKEHGSTHVFSVPPVDTLSGVSQITTDVDVVKMGKVEPSPNKDENVIKYEIQTSVTPSTNEMKSSEHKVHLAYPLVSDLESLDRKPDDTRSNIKPTSERRSMRKRKWKSSKTVIPEYSENREKPDDTKTRNGSEINSKQIHEDPHTLDATHPQLEETSTVENNQKSDTTNSTTVIHPLPSTEDESVKSMDALPISYDTDNTIFTKEQLSAETVNKKLDDHDKIFPSTEEELLSVENEPLLRKHESLDDTHVKEQTTSVEKETINRHIAEEVLTSTSESVHDEKKEDTVKDMLNEDVNMTGGSFPTNNEESSMDISDDDLARSPYTEQVGQENIDLLHTKIMDSEECNNEIKTCELSTPLEQYPGVESDQDKETENTNSENNIDTKDKQTDEADVQECSMYSLATDNINNSALSKFGSSETVHVESSGVHELCDEPVEKLDIIQSSTSNDRSDSPLIDSEIAQVTSEPVVITEWKDIPSDRNQDSEPERDGDQGEINRTSPELHNVLSPCREIEQYGTQVTSSSPDDSAESPDCVSIGEMKDANLLQESFDGKDSNTREMLPSGSGLAIFNDGEKQLKNSDDYQSENSDVHIEAGESESTDNKTVDNRTEQSLMSEDENSHELPGKLYEQSTEQSLMSEDEKSYERTGKLYEPRTEQSLMSEDKNSHELTGKIYEQSAEKYPLVEQNSLDQEGDINEEIDRDPDSENKIAPHVVSIESSEDNAKEVSTSVLEDDQDQETTGIVCHEPGIESSVSAEEPQEENTKLTMPSVQSSEANVTEAEDSVKLDIHVSDVVSVQNESLENFKVSEGIVDKSLDTCVTADIDAVEIKPVEQDVTLISPVNKTSLEGKDTGSGEFSGDFQEIPTKNLDSSEITPSSIVQNDQMDISLNSGIESQEEKKEDVEHTASTPQTIDSSLISSEEENLKIKEEKEVENVKMEVPCITQENNEPETTGEMDLIKAIGNYDAKLLSDIVDTENKSISQDDSNESEAMEAQPVADSKPDTSQEIADLKSDESRVNDVVADTVKPDTSLEIADLKSVDSRVNDVVADTVKPDTSQEVADLKSDDSRVNDVVAEDKQTDHKPITHMSDESEEPKSTVTDSDKSDDKTREVEESKMSEETKKSDSKEEVQSSTDGPRKYRRRFDQTADDKAKEKELEEDGTPARRRSGRIRSLEERKDESKEDSRSQDRGKGRDDRRDRDRRDYDDRRDSHRRDRRRHDDDDRSYRDDRRRGRDYDRYDRRDRDYRRRSRDDYDDDYDSRSSKRPYSRHEYKDRKSSHSSEASDSKKPYSEESAKFGQGSFPQESSSSQLSQSQHTYQEMGISADSRDDSAAYNQVRPEKVKSRWRRSCEAEMNDNGYPAFETSSPSFGTPPPATQMPADYMVLPPDLPTDVPTDPQFTDEKMASTTTPTVEMIPIPEFEELEDNIYMAERKRSKQMKEVRRMVCDCTTSYEERENGVPACGEDCLNRMLLIECGNRCPCGEFCQNKRFQQHVKSNVAVFQTEYKGHGLMANETLHPGQFIMEYVGEVLDYRQFKSRTKIYAKSGSEHYYFMALNGDEIIDATSKGNISRFINHSCDPNCETQKWTVNGYLRVGFFAKKELAPGEELTFDYQFEIYGREPQKCFCSTPKCRGFLGQKSTPLKSKKKSVPEPEEKDADAEMDAEQEKKKNELFEDECFEEEVEKISELGLHKKEDVLNLCRLMVRAEKEDHRQAILGIIQGTKEAACLRLFLDYHGLSLLWSWMTDIGQGFLELKKQILSALKILPISNKTILEESKILSVVRRWAGEIAKKESQSADAELNVSAEVKDEETNSEAVSPLPTTTTVNTNVAPVSILSVNKESKPAKKRVKFAIESSDSEASGEFSDTPLSDSDPQCSEVSASDSVQMTEDDQSSSEVKEYPTLKKRLKLAEASSDSLDSSGLQTTSADTSQEHSIDESKEVTQSSQVSVSEHKEEIVKLGIETNDDKVDSENSSPDDDSGSQDEDETPDEENKGEITNMAVDLLEHWSDLKDLFKIPKKERVEERKRTERELDMRITKDSYGQYGGREWSSGDRNDRKRRSEESPDKRRRDKHKKYDNEPRKSRFSPAIDPKLSNLSKRERRELFEAQVKSKDEDLRNYRDELQRQREAYIQQQCMTNSMYDPNYDPNLMDPHFPLGAILQDPNYGQEAGYEPDLSYPQDSGYLQNPNYGQMYGQDPSFMHSSVYPPDQNYPAPPHGHPPPPMEPPLPPGYPPMGTQQSMQPGVSSLMDPSMLPHAMLPDLSKPPPSFAQPPQYPVPTASTVVQPETFTVQPTPPEVPPLPVPSSVQTAAAIPSKKTKAAPPLPSTPPQPSSVPAPPISLPTISAASVTKAQLEQATDAATTLALLQQVQHLQQQLQLQQQLAAMAPQEDEDPPPPPSPPKPKQSKLPPNWKCAQDASGKTYYYHTVTRQTQWEAPSWDQGERDDMDLGTPKIFDEPTPKSKKKTTTAAADTSSEVAKKIKELFRSKMSSFIVLCLNPYRKPECKVGRVISTEDFKHLARKLTHHVMSKELKYCRHVEDLEVNESVKAKAKDYVKKYMGKFGTIYKSTGSPQPKI